jgi:hypothetical protein
MALHKQNKSIVEEIEKHPALLEACKQPQLMFVPKQNYGVRKLWKRLSDKK